MQKTYLAIVCAVSTGLFSGCLSEVPGGAGSEIRVPVQNPDLAKAILAIRMIKDLSILPRESTLSSGALRLPFTISFRRSDGAGGDLDFSTFRGKGLLQIHALAKGPDRRHLPEVEFSLIREVYLQVRQLQPDLPDPRTVTVVKDYGLIRGRKLETLQ